MQNMADSGIAKAQPSYQPEESLCTISPVSFQGEADDSADAEQGQEEVG